LQFKRISSALLILTLSATSFPSFAVADDAPAPASIPAGDIAAVPAIAGEGATPAIESQPAIQDNTTLLIDDFSDGDLVNALGGESGSWNLNPDDPKADATPSVISIEGTSGPNSVLKLAYKLESELRSQNGYWTKLRNLDASQYDHLEFDVKGDDAGFTSAFIIEVKKYKDLATRTEKLKGGYRVENVTGNWQTIRVPLNQFTGILDFSDPEAWKNPAVSRKNLDELVFVFHDRHVTKKTGAILIDNIKFIRTGNPGPSAVDFPPRAMEKTPAPLYGLDFAKFLIERLKGFPQTRHVAKEFPEDDRLLFQEVAKDTWRFFDEVVDKETHLPLDQIRMGKDSPVSEGVMIGDYTNITNVGVYLMVLVSAYDLKFITKEDAVERIRGTLDELEKLKRHESGFFYNYYDTTTSEATSYFVSFVDSAWLDAGLYVVRNAFPEELKEQADRLLSSHSFKFFYDDVEQQMRHGYYANLKAYSNYSYGAFYSESRAGSYIAIARGDVPIEHWFRIERVFPGSYTWQRSEPKRFRNVTLGIEHVGGFYEWRGMRFVPSWGGSSFEAFMPQLILDEPRLAPKGLGLNGQIHAKGQITYAMEELGYPVWGMSPSAVPDGEYGEFGAAPFGSKGYPAGVITPHASVLPIGYEPAAVAKNIRELVKRYPIYGEYGFYDAVSMETGHVAERYLCLDQAMLFVAIGNYLTDNAIRKRFHQDSVMATAEKLLTSEELFKTGKDAAPEAGSAGGNDEGVTLSPVTPQGKQV